MESLIYGLINVHCSSLLWIASYRRIFNDRPLGVVLRVDDRWAVGSARIVRISSATAFQVANTAPLARGKEKLKFFTDAEVAIG